MSVTLEVRPTSLPSLPVAGVVPGVGVTGRVVKLVITASLAGALVAVALPRLTGAEWPGILASFGSLSALNLLLLSLVWVLGLWAHTPSLTAALPGLTHRRALQLNLAGSFVSNLLPLGGAAGAVANWRMARSWGFGAAPFGRFALLTNLVDTGLKLLFPGAALLALAWSGGESGDLVEGAAYGGVMLLALVGIGGWVLARDDRALAAVGRRVDRVCHRVSWLHPPAEPYAARAVAFRRDSAALVAAGWRPLVGGKLAYAVLQAGLLWLALGVTGASVGVTVVLAAFAVERVLSLVALTPGATGFVECGMTGVLVALHADPAAAAAGVLVYRAFTFGAEIPVGGLALLSWSLTRPHPTEARRAVG